MQVRLNKHLADLGICSRREGDALIEAGKVFVNGKRISQLGTKIDPAVDEVKVNRQTLEKRQERMVYILLNKPVGYVSTVKATKQDPRIVLDLVKIKERIYPVGRLDKDTTGLLILTNDGTLTHKLTHPSSHSEKEYEVTLFGKITEQALEKLRKGVRLWGEKTLPAKVKRVSEDTVRIVLIEGKNRQIRRMCQKVGYEVKALKRIRIKGLEIGSLQNGHWRYLTPDEVNLLKTTA